MPPLSTHFRFAAQILPSLGVVSHAGSFLLGTTAPDAFEFESESSFSRHHFNSESGRISLPDFVKTMYFTFLPSDDSVWSFTCGYYCHLWLDVFYRNNADRISIQRPAGMPDADVRGLVRRETEILNAPYVLEAANLPIPQSEELLLPPGLEFVDPERCNQLVREVIKQSRELSILSPECELIDHAGYAAFLEYASKRFLDEFQMSPDRTFNKWNLSREK